MVVAGSLPWIERLPSDTPITRLWYPNLSSCVRSFEKYSHLRPTPRGSGLSCLRRPEDLFTLGFPGRGSGCWLMPRVQRRGSENHSALTKVLSMRCALFHTCWLPLSCSRVSFAFGACSSPWNTLHRKAGQQQTINTNRKPTWGCFQTTVKVPGAP